jgi:hypothetical protein
VSLPDPASPGATGRLAYVNGPRELHAALLALLLPPAPPDATVVCWRAETEAVIGAAMLRDEIAALAGAGRLPCFEDLLARMAGQPLAARQALLESTRRLMRAGGTVRPIDRLHWLLMRLRLGERAFYGERAHAAPDIAELPESDVHAIARYTAYLSRMVPGTDAPNAGDAWYESAMALWQPRGIVPARQVPDADALVHALQELQEFAWTVRPALLRGWVVAALQHSRFGRLTDGAADALYLSGRLLDVPLPPELARHYAPTLQEP